MLKPARTTVTAGRQAKVGTPGAAEQWEQEGRQQKQIRHYRQDHEVQQQ
jgi:hypothetical protein